MNEVKHTDSIAGHPVVPILARMMVEVAEYSAYDIALHWEQSAFYIEGANGSIIAAMSYHKLGDRSEYYIHAAYVVPEFRRIGLYRRLFDSLVSKAKADDIRSISGGIAYSNETMRKVAEAVGRKPVSVTYTVEI